MLAFSFYPIKTPFIIYIHIYSHINTHTYAHKKEAKKKKRETDEGKKRRTTEIDNPFSQKKNIYTWTNRKEFLEFLKIDTKESLCHKYLMCEQPLSSVKSRYNKSLQKTLDITKLYLRWTLVKKTLSIVKFRYHEPWQKQVSRKRLHWVYQTLLLELSSFSLS